MTNGGVKHNTFSPNLQRSTHSATLTDNSRTHSNQITLFAIATAMYWFEGQPFIVAGSSISRAFVTKVLDFSSGLVNFQLGNSINWEKLVCKNYIVCNLIYMFNLCVFVLHRTDNLMCRLKHYAFSFIFLLRWKVYVYWTVFKWRLM